MQKLVDTNSVCFDLVENEDESPYKDVSSSSSSNQLVTNYLVILKSLKPAIPILFHFIILGLGFAVGCGIIFCDSVYDVTHSTNLTHLEPSTGTTSLLINDDPENDRRRMFVREMAVDAWNAYSTYAWGSNALKPVEKIGEAGDKTGSTIIQALSTLWVMDLKKEYSLGVEWIQQNDLTKVNLSRQVAVQDYLGSMLSCYALTQNKFFLEKSRHLTEKLRKETEKYSKKNPSNSEFKQNLELRYLSKLTRDQEYENLLSIQKDGFRELGVLGTYLQSNGSDEKAFQEYSGYLETLFDESLVMDKGDHVYVKEDGTSKMSYRKCILGAILALSAHALELRLAKTKSKLQEFEIKRELYQIHRKWSAAERFTETCHGAARQTRTGGLAPEWIIFSESGKMIIDEHHIYITPELAQSYFVLWRLTGDRKYRDYAWEFAYALYEHSRVVSGGYRNLVRGNKNSDFDIQPAEFIGSTLKYLYLTFADEDLLPLDQWVFSQAGQPLPVLG